VAGHAGRAILPIVNFLIYHPDHLRSRAKKAAWFSCQDAQGGRSEPDQASLLPAFGFIQFERTAEHETLSMVPAYRHVPSCYNPKVNAAFPGAIGIAKRGKVY
jgi:hypothetical protein